MGKLDERKAISTRKSLQLSLSKMRLQDTSTGFLPPLFLLLTKTVVEWLSLSNPEMSRTDKIMI
jgi:hypothetical protein